MAHQRVQLLQLVDIRLDRLQILAYRHELGEHVLMHLFPLRLLVLSDGVAQLGFGELLRRAGFLFLELAAQIPLFLDRLAGAFGVGLELLGDGGEPRLIVGANARPHVPRRRVR